MNDGQIKQSKGAFTEAKVTEKLLELGFGVSKPLFKPQKYDLIIDDGNKLYKAQVKSCYDSDREGRKHIGLSRGHPTSNGFKNKSYNDSDIDGFISYITEMDDIIWLPISKAGNRQFTICLSEKYIKCRGSNKDKVNLVEDYRIDGEKGI